MFPFSENGFRSHFWVFTDSAENYLFEGMTEVLQSVSLYNDKNSLEQRLFDPRKRPVYWSFL